MASRDLVYRVTLDTSQARRAAQNIRQTIEAELRTIQVGQLNISSLTAATNEAQRFRHELEQAAQVASSIQVKSGAIPTTTPGSGVRRGGGGGQDLTGVLDQIPVVGQLGSALAGGFAVGAVVAGIKEIGQALDDLSRRGAVFGQIDSVLKDYAASVGTTGDAIISAAQKAAQGTISEYELILNANRAIQFEVAKTPEQYAKLIELSTALGRAQGISDTQALEYLTTGLARESRLILDNLGLIINLDEATAKYAATLGKTADELSSAERKQALLDEAFRQGAVAIAANKDAADSAATQYEKFDANVQNLKDTFGQWLSEVSASNIGAIADAIGRVNAELSGDRRSSEGISKDLTELIAMRDKLASGENVSAMGVVIPGNAESVDFYNKKIDETTEKLKALNLAASEAYTFEIPQADKLIAQAKAIEDARIAARQDEIGSEQSTINKGLDSAAAKSVGTLGLEQTLALLKQEKALVDASIQELIASSVTDPAELSLRIAEIQQASQQAFTDAVEAMPELPEIDPGITAGSFDIISQSLTDLNQGFVDFLPNMSAARDELISLQTEVALTGITTEEQAAALEYLSSAALAVADDTGLLAEVTNGLGVAFLAANPEAAGLVDAMYSAQASYLSGAITAQQYAGILSVLGGQLLTLASQAGVATGSILQLVAAQGGLAGTSGFAQGQTIGGGVAQRIKAQDDARQRTEARKAAVTAAREAEAAAKRAAREQESAAKRAGKALETAAKKAADELKSALKSVPGLFGRSSVTKEQMDLASQGVPQNFADDYLRRLQDEVFNNKDWADVSIEEAKAALAKIGVTASDNNKAAFEQFAQAWESSALFADKENLSFINQEAVKLQLDLQEKAKQGQANIYELFGIAVDEAVESVGSGISGGGISTGAAGGGITIPVKGELIPMTAEDTAGAGGGTFAITPTIDTQAIQDQLNLLTLPDFKITAMGLADLQTQIEGVTTKVTITATLAATAGADLSSDLADQLSAQIDTFKSQGKTIGDVIKAGFSESFNSIQGDQVVTTDLADAIIGSVGTQLGARVKRLEGVGAGVGDIIKTSIAKDMGTVQWQDGEIVAPIANGLITAISTQVRGTTEGFKREGGSIAQIVMSGISSGLGGVSAEGIQSADLAFVLAGNLNTQFATNANFFYAAGQVPAQNVLSGYKGYFTSDSNEGAPLVTPMVSAINTQIRVKAEDFKNQGLTIAQYVQAGVSIGFNSESFKSALVAVGESLYASIRTGLINAADGGDLVDSLGSKILADLAQTVEQPQ